jgi:hypothetical protein
VVLRGSNEVGRIHYSLRVRKQTLWLRVGRLYVPTMARADDGQIAEVAPVTVLRAESKAVADLLAQRLQAPVPAALAPNGTPAVPEAAGLPSWERFLVGAAGAEIEETAEGWRIVVQRGGSQVGTRTLPSDAPPEQLAEDALGALSAALAAPPLVTPPLPSVVEERSPAGARGGGTPTMLLSSVMTAVAMAALLLAVFASVTEIRAFGDPANLALFGAVLLLLAIFLLMWEIVLRLVARTEE